MFCLVFGPYQKCFVQYLAVWIQNAIYRIEECFPHMFNEWWLSSNITDDKPSNDGACSVVSLSHFSSSGLFSNVSAPLGSLMRTSCSIFLGGSKFRYCTLLATWHLADDVLWFVFQENVTASLNKPESFQTGMKLETLKEGKHMINICLITS